MSYVCEQCQDDGQEFVVPADEIGVAVMQQHLESEHGILMIALQTCGECGGSVRTKWGAAPPASCKEHQ